MAEQTLPYRVFDADHHYYEALDAFTRHMPRHLAKRGMQWVELEGRTRLLVGGKVNRFIPNPTFHPVARPGCLYDFFKGKNDEHVDLIQAFGELEPIHPEYRDREIRLRVMDDQDVEGALLFPTLGVGMEEAMKDDPEALCAAFHAFNQWLDEDWGFAYEERLFGTPVIPLVDPDNAVRELEWCLDHDVRVICIKLGPVHTVHGNRSPADAMFDPFWSRVAESGIVAAFHGGDAGYQKLLADWEPVRGDLEAFRSTPMQTIITSDRAALETFAALVCHGLFARFPNIRIASIENGSGWVPELLRKLKKVGAQHPHVFAEDPVETFKRHVWVAPFWEDDARTVVHAMGPDQVVFGSDWPHAEGLVQPLDYVSEIAGLADDVIQKVMRDNARTLVVPQPA
jgi:predicted TIM-barrel fold metal-dependent hydrolase